MFIVIFDICIYIYSETYIRGIRFVCLHVSKVSSRQAVSLAHPRRHALAGIMSNRLAPEQLRSAVARFSGDTLSTLSRLLESKENATKAPSGAFKRKVQATLAPYAACFRAIHVASCRDGESVETFYVASMKDLLRCVASQCPSLQEVFRAHSVAPLCAIFAHDECTSGNVLNPLMRQKTLIFYVSFTCLSPILKSSRAWFPVAAIPHDQMEHCVGGMSAVTAAFVQSWTQDALDVPFRISDDIHVSLQLKIFVSDLDSQRGAFAAKGSAGLKPCIFCSNCLMNNAEGAVRDGHFRTIAEHDLTLFHQNQKSDLETTIKYWIGLLPRMSKQEIGLRERCLGFNLDPHSLWNSPPAVLNVFNIDMVMNDAMHCYFATGICNSEIILLLQAAKEHTGATLQDLCTACCVAHPDLPINLCKRIKPL